MSQINAQVGLIKRMFKWAVAEELIPPSVSRGLAAVTGLRMGRCGARETAPVLPVEDQVVDQTLPWMGPVVADMVRLQRITGMRPAEVYLLRPCDIDRTKDVWVYRPASHKTPHHGKARNVHEGKPRRLPGAADETTRFITSDGGRWNRLLRRNETPPGWRPMLPPRDVQPLNCERCIPPNRDGPLFRTVRVGGLSPKLWPRQMAWQLRSLAGDRSFMSLGRKCGMHRGTAVRIRSPYGVDRT